jgi:hypothetical protein
VRSTARLFGDRLGRLLSFVDLVFFCGFGPNPQIENSQNPFTVIELFVNFDLPNPQTSFSFVDLGSADTNENFHL